MDIIYMRTASYVTEDDMLFVWNTKCEILSDNSGMYEGYEFYIAIAIERGHIIEIGEL